MSGSELEPVESDNNGLSQPQKTNVLVMPQGESSAVVASEDLSGAIERFSHLSSDLTESLLDLWRIVRNSAEQLQSVQSSVEIKRGELKSLEAQIDSERRAWEEEKTRRMQQEAAYDENLKLQRQREEEEYKRVWELEKAKAQQQLEEELRRIQQESRLKQESLERDCQQRERLLKEKELEWTQFTQELEQFMSRLGRRLQPNG